MKAKSGTELAILELVKAKRGGGMSHRESYLFRESLYSLVRLAQSELLTEIRANAARLTGLPPAQKRGRGERREARPVQQRFEFNQ